MTIVANIRRSVARQVAVDVAAAVAGVADWSAQWFVHTLDHHGHRTLIDAPELGPVIDHRVAPPVRPHHAIARIQRAAQAVDDRASAGMLHTLMAAASTLAVLAMLASITIGRASSASDLHRFVADRAPAGHVSRSPIPAVDRNAPDPAPPPAAAPAVPVPAAPATPAAAPVAAAPGKPVLPVGKGMWIYLPQRTENGDVNAIVARAGAVGLSHIFVRTGSSIDGFNTQDFLAQLLPVAHAHGLRVYGWDFPYLKNADDDVQRAVAAIKFTAPDGSRIDGFSADIEVAPGVNLTPGTAMTYGTHLRSAVGGGYPLIVTVPRPSDRLVTYPWDEVTAAFDAIAPMVYWLGQDPATMLSDAMQTLGRFHKPLFPVGQAYDGAGEGGPAGVPPRDELQRFISIAHQGGATGVSFWSWQAADQQAWDALRDAPEFKLGPLPAITAAQAPPIKPD
jgi:hypothetical protein